MTERPIIFSGPMVRAIIEGRKSMTRRVLKPMRGTTIADAISTGRKIGIAKIMEVPREKLAVPYAPGDMLWVREAWRAEPEFDGVPPKDIPTEQRPPIIYEADGTATIFGKLRHGIFMCRWMSRITLKVTGVKVERVHDISEEDAVAEGIERLKSGRGYYDPRLDHGAVHMGYCTTAKDAFSLLWQSINGTGSWEANPWVAAISFERMKP